MPAILAVAAALLSIGVHAQQPTATPDAFPAGDSYPSTYKPYPGVPTVVRNATIYDGEGGRIEGGSVLFADGKIVQVGRQVPVPAGAVEVDGTGKWVTPGIIDVHSHLGNYPSPPAHHDDRNEATNPITPQVSAEHGIWAQDPGFMRALMNGGVTTQQILPGSYNLFGGRSVTIKTVPARTVQAMKFPGAPYGLKMACGENPKRHHGSLNRMPSTRMGNMALFRQAWTKAAEYRRQVLKSPETPRDLALETLVGALEGKIIVHVHCYRADDIAFMIDLAKEFGFRIAVFHHAVEAYKIADLLRDNGMCVAMWADWGGFKMEAYDAIRENIPMIHAAGGCALVHSDDQYVIQRLNHDVAKALWDGRRMGIEIPDEVAWTWLAINAARALGIAEVTGSLRAGKMADVVLWNGDPLSVYTRPEKVWIDGALLYDAHDPKRWPVSDFELGQPGEGDAK